MATLLGNPLKIAFGFRESDIVTASDCDSQVVNETIFGTGGNLHEQSPEFLEWHDSDRNEDFSIYIAIPTSITNTTDITTQLDLDLNGILQSTLSTSTMNTADRISGYCFLFEQWDTDAGEGAPGTGASGHPGSGNHTRRKIYPSANEDESVWVYNGGTYQFNFRSFVDNLIGTANKERTEQYFPHWNYEYTSEAANRNVYPVGTTEPDPYSYDDSALYPKQTFRLNLGDLNGWNGKFDPSSTYSGVSNSQYFIGIHFTVDNTVGSGTSDDFGFGVKTFDIKAAQSSETTTTNPNLIVSDPNVIDFTANVGGSFGHHVATLDTTRVHTSEPREAVALFYNQPGSNTLNPKFLNYSQYNVTLNQYVVPGYFVSPSTTIETTNEFNQPLLLQGDQPEITLRFDFADYIGLQGTGTATGTITNTLDSGSDTSFVIFDRDRGQSGDPAQITDLGPGESQTFSATFTLASTGLDTGFLLLSIKQLSASNLDRAKITDLRCSVTVTGRTRVNTSNVFINTFTELDDLVGTGGASTRDSAIRFENFNRGSVLAGNPAVHGIVTNFGILDNLYPNGSSTTENIEGRFQNQYHQLSDVGLPTQDVELVIRKNNADVLTSTIDITDNFEKFGIGGAPIEAWQSGDTLVEGLTDLPAINNFVALNDSSLSLADTTDIDIELRYIYPPQDSTDPRSADDDFQDSFVSARLLLNPPFIAEDIETKSTFTVSELYYIDANFTATFVGGILQLGSASLTSEFDLTPEATGAGVIINGGAVNTTVNFGINDIYQLDTRFTADFVGNQRHQPTVDIAFNLAQSLVASETGIIIANEKTTTFNWAVTVDSVVFVTPDRYRELLLPAQTRTYAVTEEKRDYAVNTESRSYLVQQEQRQRTVDTETRTITEKGYSS